MLQGFTRCTPNATYTLPFSVPVHRTISPGLFGPVHQIRLAAPFTSIVLRPRFQLCSPSSSPEPSSLLVSETVLHPRFQLCSPESSTLPSSVPSPSFVLHPRLRNCSPSSSPRLRIDCSTLDTQTMPVLFLVNFFRDDVFSATCK